ncbi:transglycosylase SLT domain-containing protein [Cyanobium sp. CH-040]|uniref:transglycosylase SLT domain-containing protein n=1 Tax=Cyanobium sp. CH-040 TaxID=2823708 RepID=UPI0020CF66A0|nr:transglycosylase SLT domain-containing protein [Cyanobium sp. CH-040]MCP9927441.1 transglycosylase SLT domain-containing protein [Cyanobium sp. CH-040]
MRCSLPRLSRPAVILVPALLVVAVSWVAPHLLASETPQADALAAIRQVWPEEHETAAISVAYKESGLSPTARGCNGDCFGLFQIHYAANQRLIASMGITRPEQLFDPVINSTVAYRLFREAGWTPWGVKP